jgi:hypothetical protein
MLWRGRMTAGKRLGTVKNVVPEEESWTTLRRLEELGGKW